MILTSLIVGVVLAASVAAFWKDIVNWLNRAIAKVKAIVKGIVFGAKVFVKKLSEGIKEISRHYSKNGTQWEETTVTKTISESEVPKDILEKANAYGGVEAEITDELELQLQA